MCAASASRNSSVAGNRQSRGRLRFASRCSGNPCRPMDEEHANSTSPGDSPQEEPDSNLRSRITRPSPNRCNHLISHRRKGRPVLVPRREPHGFPVILDRDQKFESSFLQRRVRVSYSPGRCRSRTRWFRAGVRRSVGGAVGRRRAGRSKIAPKNSNNSVGPYSSITLQSLRGKGIASLSRACTAKVRLAKDPYAEGAPGRLGACWA